MSSFGITRTVLATQLSEAVKKDGDATNLADGKFGPFIQEWLNEVAHELDDRAQPTDLKILGFGPVSVTLPMAEKSRLFTIKNTGKHPITVHGPSTQILLPESEDE